MLTLLHLSNDYYYRSVWRIRDYTLFCTIFCWLFANVECFLPEKHINDSTLLIFVPVSIGIILIVAAVIAIIARIYYSRRLPRTNLYQQQQQQAENTINTEIRRSFSTTRPPSYNQVVDQNQSESTTSNIQRKESSALVDTILPPTYQTVLGITANGKSDPTLPPPPPNSHSDE